MKKVCHITSAHSARDIRIFYKECITLASNGYNVFLISPGTEVTTFEQGVNLLFVTPSSSRFKRMAITTFKIFIKAIKVNADIYHFHDPELIPICLLLRLMGKRVIYDVHEDLPQDIYTKRWIKTTILKKLISICINVFEKSCALMFNGIVVSTEDIKDKFYNKNTVIISNYPVLAEIDKAIPFVHKNKIFQIIYAGGLSQQRGIYELIDAMNIVNNSSITLLLFGKWENEAFRKECTSNSGWKYVEYNGIVPPEQLYSYLKSSDIGVCTLHPSKGYLKSKPIKIFEYMACSIPMIISDFPYWKQIFNENAIFVSPYSSQQIANGILWFYNNPSERIRMGKIGRIMNENKFSWEFEITSLLNMYNKCM